MAERGIRIAAALSAALAIAAGAFGAHGAANAEAADWLRTGGSYQLLHAIAALVIAHAFPRSAWALLAGAGWFALTLYLMAIGGPRWLGALTPVGGVAMIGGWLAVAWSAWRTEQD